MYVNSCYIKFLNSTKNVDLTAIKNPVLITEQYSANNKIEFDATVPNLSQYTYLICVYSAVRTEPSSHPCILPYSIFKKYSSRPLILRHEDIDDTYKCELTYKSDTTLHFKFNDLYGRTVWIYGIK